MYIIVGLGNPGREYENTRHNIGFHVLDKLAEREGISILEKRHKAVIGKGVAAGQRCVLAKPMTYMNLSGESVRQLIDFYKIDETAELIVISDDISLDVGQIRIRKKGSAGGHNGLKNIIANLGHDSFIRVKMGVGAKPPEWDLVDYVLGRFSPKEWEIMDEAAERAAEAVCAIIAEGADAAMNRYNVGKRQKGEANAGKCKRGEAADKKTDQETGKKPDAEPRMEDSGGREIPGENEKVSGPDAGGGTDIKSQEAENAGTTGAASGAGGI